MIKRDRRSVFAGVGVITLAVIITAALLATLLNSRCQSQFRDTLMVYPGAELVTEDYPFLGQQRVELYSPDAPETVQAWYTAQRAAKQREQVTSGDFSQPLPENWLIEAAANRGGSVITLSEQCP